MKMRRLSLFFLLALTVNTARAELPPYEDWHPRLLVDETELAALPDSIAADSVKAGAWDSIVILAEQYDSAPPQIVLGNSWGFTRLPALGLAAHLAEEPLASASRDRVRETVLYLAETEDVWGSGDDLDSALRLHALLVGYDLAFGGTTEAERETALAEIRAYLEVMTTDFTFTRGVYNPYCSNHSIAIGALLGMSELCLRGEWPGDPLLTAARSLGDSLIDKGVGDLLGADGSYAEGGLYLAYIHRFLIPYWEAALRIDGLALWDEDKLAAVFEWTAYLLTPEGGGRFLNRNDSPESTRPLALHGALWEWALRRLSDPRLARWVREHVSGEHGFDYGLTADKVSIVLHHRAGERVHPASEFPPQGRFPDQGLYVWRDSWPGDPARDSFHFSLQAGRFLGGHWQEDVGQFTLRAFGHRFAMDHGGGDYAAETEAHNLPLVAGLGQHNAGEGIGTDGELSVLLGGGFCRALRSDMEPAYSGHSPFNDPDWPLPGTDWSWGYDGGNPLEQADRWVLLFPPALPGDAPDLYLLDDLRKDGELHPMEWRLHFEEGLALGVSGDLYRLSGGAGRLDARLLAPPVEETSWSLGAYDNGGPDDESQVLSVHHSAIDGRFLWQLLARYPTQTEPPVEVERFAGGLRATMGGEPFLRRVLVCAWEDSLLTAGDELHGRFAVREEGAGPGRHALVAGTEFWREGQLYFRLTPAASASVDGLTVQISDPDLAFVIYAPDAIQVIADGVPVPYHREGDYVLDTRETGLPPDLGAGGLQQSWSLRVLGRGIGGEPVRLQARGPAAADVRLEIFDVRGRRVARLYRGALPPGGQEFLWQGSSETGRRLPAGVYLARLAVGKQTASAKLILLR